MAIKLQNTSLNRFDLWLIKLSNYKSGWIRVQDSINRYKLYPKIFSKKREKTRLIVLYSGENIEHFAKKVAKQANLNANKLLKIYHQKVGLKNKILVARKYKIPFHTNEDSLISYILYKSHKIIKNTSPKDIDIDSKEFYNKMIIASIVQKETQNPKEMPIIASVIYNRLKNGIKLQMDATLNYGKWTNTPITPKKIREDNSLYNTYKHKGLPPKILCAVSTSAIKASLHPANTNYIYFVKGVKKHIFSKKYKKHQKYVKKYKDRLAMYRHIKKILYVKFYQPTAKFRLNYKKLDIIAPKKE